MMLKVGDLAPDFELKTDDGSLLRLSDLRGKKVVLFFYPKADTPGCTAEACSFRDHAPEFDARGAVILGISPDEVKAVSKFRQKYDLPYHLLADPDHATAEAYGVWVEKSMYGKKYWGAARTTFTIDEQGRIADIQANIKPVEHVENSLAAL